MDSNVELCYFIIAVLPGCTMTLFMVLAYLKYRNPYLGLFTLAYLGTGVMAFTFLVRAIFEKSLNIAANFFEMFSMGLIIEGVVWLVIKLFYEKTGSVFRVFVYLMGLIPLFGYAAAYFFCGNYVHAVYDGNYLCLFGILIISAAVFGGNQRKLNHVANRKFGNAFWFVLLFFLFIFVIQRIVPGINFNPLLAFYLVWSILLIRFSWKYVFSTGLGALFHVQRSFAERYNITKREEEIIEFTLRGYKNSAIGEELFISEKTVTNHVYNIYKKLGINSRFELICWFKQ